LSTKPTANPVPICPGAPQQLRTTNGMAVAR
jgi:hypothetical protein